MVEERTVAFTISRTRGFLSLPESDWVWKGCEGQGSSLGGLGRDDSPSEGPMVRRDSLTITASDPLRFSRPPHHRHRPLQTRPTVHPLAPLRFSVFTTLHTSFHISLRKVHLVLQVLVAVKSHSLSAVCHGQRESDF